VGEIRKRALDSSFRSLPNQQKALHGENNFCVYIVSQDNMQFRAGVLKALGWKKGMALKIERNPDGSVTVRKA